MYSYHPEFDAHEHVRVFDLDHTGGRAIIAVHSTHRGPAVGGCKVWRYAESGAPLSDALRLSRGMSYKNALAELPFGGGKAVILPPAGPYDRTRLFEAFGKTVESLGGVYITAEDDGSCVADMPMVETQTRHVGGLPARQSAAGGDPSPWTALGVFLSIAAALKWRTGRTLEGARVSVQGAGAVGADLCRRLADVGAKVTLADVDNGRAERVAARTGAAVLAPCHIHRIAADVFAPCALGGALSADTIPELAAPIVCGAANNQLAKACDGEKLMRRGVLYCPDYVVNAGGIIAVHCERNGEGIGAAPERLAAIPERLVEILRIAEYAGRSPEAVADGVARKRIGRCGELMGGSRLAGSLVAAGAD